MTASDAVRWLDPAEQHAWRCYRRGTRAVDVALDRVMQDHGISLSELEVLITVSEAPERQLRMSELAEIVIQSRSRLTHTAARLEKAGLVTRGPCEEDRRGVLLELTPAGLARLEELAMVHVTSVREELLDVLTAGEFLELGRLMGKVCAAHGYPWHHLYPVPDDSTEPTGYTDSDDPIRASRT